MIKSRVRKKNEKENEKRKRMKNGQIKKGIKEIKNTEKKKKLD